MKIAIGNDHSALAMKAEVIPFLESLGHEVIDFGTYTLESCDYPVYGKKVAEAVQSHEADCGVLICGTGVGMSLVANKYKGIRCALCSEPLSARLTKEHNNSNIIAFGARVVGPEMAKMILTEYLNAEFTNEERHLRRLEMIREIEENQ